MRKLIVCALILVSFSCFAKTVTYRARAEYPTKYTPFYTFRIKACVPDEPCQYSEVTVGYNSPLTKNYPDEAEVKVYEIAHDIKKFSHANCIAIYPDTTIWGSKWGDGYAQCTVTR